jgi:hypothetical protein
MGDTMAAPAAVAVAQRKFRIPSFPSGWRHWTVYGWRVVVRNYAPYRIEAYDPQGHLVARGRNMWRAMTWALAQRSAVP